MKILPPILIVEDDQNDVLLIRRTLGTSGIPNPRHFVESGEVAIDYLLGANAYSDRKRYPLPALILLDLKLPGIDGFKVLQWIRGNRVFRDLRVVVLTSSNAIRDVNKAYRLGANSFLVKPLEFENASALFATIGTQLWKSNTQAQADTIEKAARTNDDANWSLSRKDEGSPE
ncbi:MAG TPA: response regulator [Candidatus Limnocylindrales bacterium]|jgi:CheY-like chemotaxis protein|nr:response regulator [Candidatus Limnocylindrales bacterium]